MDSYHYMFQIPRFIVVLFLIHSGNTSSSTIILFSKYWQIVPSGKSIICNMFFLKCDFHDLVSGMDKQTGSSSGGSYGGTGTKADLDNHGNQCNPNNTEYKGKHIFRLLS